jgi:hypothetical protein
MQLQYAVNCNTDMYRTFTKCVSFSIAMEVINEEMLSAKENVHVLYTCNHLPYKE